jgi:hypothetical protein
MRSERSRLSMSCGKCEYAKVKQTYLASISCASCDLPGQNRHIGRFSATDGSLIQKSTFGQTVAIRKCLVGRSRA